MTPLRRIRIARGLNQGAFESIGIDQATISRIERSDRTRLHPERSGATAEHAARLARFLGHAITEAEILYPGDYQAPDSEMDSADEAAA